MTALPDEIEGAVAEGIEVQTLKAPSKIDVDENGHVKGLYVTPQMISKIKDGRASVNLQAKMIFISRVQLLLLQSDRILNFNILKKRAFLLNAAELCPKNTVVSMIFRAYLQAVTVQTPCFRY